MQPLESSPGHSSTFTCPRRAQELSPQGAKVRGRAGLSHTHRRETAPLPAPQGERTYISQRW